MIELFYRYGNLLNLRSQWAITSLISTAESFKLLESISSDGDHLIEELNSKLSRSVTDEMTSIGDFDSKEDFCPHLGVNLHQNRTGGVCDLTQWGPEEYLL